MFATDVSRSLTRARSHSSIPVAFSDNVRHLRVFLSSLCRRGLETLSVSCSSAFLGIWPGLAHLAVSWQHLSLMTGRGRPEVRVVEAAANACSC